MVRCDASDLEVSTLMHRAMLRTGGVVSTSGGIGGCGCQWRCETLQLSRWRRIRCTSAVRQALARRCKTRDRGGSGCCTPSRTIVQLTRCIESCGESSQLHTANSCRAVYGDSTPGVFVCSFVCSLTRDVRGLVVASHVERGWAGRSTPRDLPKSNDMRKREKTLRGCLCSTARWLPRRRTLWLWY